MASSKVPLRIPEKYGELRPTFNTIQRELLGANEALAELAKQTAENAELIAQTAQTTAEAAQTTADAAIAGGAVIAADVENFEFINTFLER